MPPTAAKHYPELDVVPREAARRLFMLGAGLLDAPERPASSREVLEEIRRIGFVQLDSISIVERAHHHILWTRLHGYRPPLLDELQRAGEVFEHWTHDASYIPSELFPHWRHRFDRVPWAEWIRRRLGRGGQKIAVEVLERVRREGPLLARDFEHKRSSGSGGWWDWKPAKAALELWWRRGELLIPRRERFEKVYDAAERVLPRHTPLPAPEIDEHVAWACESAIERLGVATAKEVAAFWNAVTAQQATTWCAGAAREGRIVPMRVEGDDRKAGVFAVADWKDRAAAAPPPPRELRLLSPFDPVVRDRARAQRLFGFDYRFEAFTPEAKRVHGYYVLPVLEGERLVARVDPKLDRKQGVLVVQGVWWERGMRPRKRVLGDALERYAAFCGVERVEVER